jgi:hypothetical protein
MNAPADIPETALNELSLIKNIKED